MLIAVFCSLTFVIDSIVHTCALYANHTVTCFGCPSLTDVGQARAVVCAWLLTLMHFQCHVPTRAGVFAQVATAMQQSCGVLLSGQVICWYARILQAFFSHHALLSFVRPSDFSNMPPPSMSFVQISLGPTFGW